MKASEFKGFGIPFNFSLFYYSDTIELLVATIFFSGYELVMLWIWTISVLVAMNFSIYYIFIVHGFFYIGNKFFVQLFISFNEIVLRGFY